VPHLHNLAGASRRVSTAALLTLLEPLTAAVLAALILASG